MWVSSIAVADLPPASWKQVETPATSILLFNIEGQFYAIENVCTHDGGPLADGCLEQGEIVCLRHGARFCIRTGIATHPPAYEDLKTFAVRVREGRVQIQIDK